MYFPIWGQVTIILTSPARWTLSFSRNHNHSCPRGNVTLSTRNNVVHKIIKYTSNEEVILCTKYPWIMTVWYVPTHIRCPIEVVRIISKVYLLHLLLCYRRFHQLSQHTTSQFLQFEDKYSSPTLWMLLQWELNKKENVISIILYYIIYIIYIILYCMQWWSPFAILLSMICSRIWTLLKRQLHELQEPSVSWAATMQAALTKQASIIEANLKSVEHIFWQRFIARLLRFTTGSHFRRKTVLCCCSIFLYS